MPELSIPITARFTFRPERAAEFLEGEQIVTQVEVDGVDEVMDYVAQFDDALTDACAIINGQVVNLSDFATEL